MKLAEALNLRADLRRRIEQLRVRLTQNAKVQEGESPQENPKDLLAELDGCLIQFEALITAINHANTRVTDSNGVTMTALIARRDSLTLRLSVLREFAGEAASLVNRHMSSDIKILSSVDVRALRVELDEKSKVLRELNTKIQGLNWTTELEGYQP
jgi:hypothetical protein